LRLIVVCALALAGCGGAVSEPRPALDMSKYGPRHAVDRASVPAAVVKPKGTVGADQVGVMDIAGAVGVRPAVLATSSDASVSRLRWTAWSRAGASARGEFSYLDCQPNCAAGHTRRVAATVRLSGVRVCAGRSYFGKAEVTLASGPRPTSYVRAPC
jgi:hypothetical protein